MVNVIVLNYNDSQTTKRLVDSIEGYDNIQSVVIVDNKSTDKSYSELCMHYYNHKKIIVLQSDKNGGYGYGNNYGLKYVKKELGNNYALICNPDVLFSEATVNELEYFLQQHRDAAIVSPMMLNAEYKKVYSCVWRIPTAIESASFSSMLLSRFCSSFYYNRESFDQDDAMQVDCVAGSMLLVDLDKFPKPSIYDEKIFLYCEETVLGIKVKQLGYHTYLLTNSTFVHVHSASINKTYPKQIQQYKLMWKSRIYMIRTYLAKSKGEVLYAYFSKIETLMEKRLIYLIRKLKEKIHIKRQNKEAFRK